MNTNQQVLKSVPVVVEEIYKASLEKVWNAITDENQMREWFFPEMKSFKPVVGFETQFYVMANRVNYLHRWKVLEVVPFKKLSFEWKYPDYSGDSYVVFEISGDNKTTEMKFSHFGIETFPHNNPDFSRESCTGGWNYFIGKSLKEYLEKEEDANADYAPDFQI